MKLVSSFKALVFTNILTAGLMVALMIHLKQREVQRRDQLIMTVLVGDVAAHKFIMSERVDNAREQIVTNIKLIVSARNQFSPFGYGAWQNLDSYLKQEGVIPDRRPEAEPHPDR